MAFCKIGYEVESSNIYAIGYTPNILVVQFKGGQDYYVYADVSPQQFAELMAATSIGTHLNQQIKPHHVVKRFEASDIGGPFGQIQSFDDYLVTALIQKPAPAPRLRDQIRSWQETSASDLALTQWSW